MGDAPAAEKPIFELIVSRQFPAWLAEQRISLAFTTYQAGKLFFLGLQPDGRLAVGERTFNRCMGLAAPNTQTLWMSSLYQLWRFENVVPEGQRAGDVDRLYVPMVAYTTGDLDIHDIAVDRQGRVVFVNTLFSCLATISESHSFVPLWQPPWISKLAAEDRCHMNGMALRDGEPRYVTAVSRADVADGWRTQRVGSGVVVEVPSGEPLLTGLAMPHSPRWHNNRLWLSEAGSGYVGYVDQASSTFEKVAFCPGFLRGLAMWGDFAIVGLSRPRHNRTFQGLPLDDELHQRNATAQCGIAVLDLRSGDLVHWCWLDGVVEELYDVVVLPQVVRPMALGFKTDEIRRVLRVGDFPPDALGEPAA